MEPYELGLTEIVKAIRKRELRASDLARSLIARLEAVDPKLHAMAFFNREQFLADARSIDKKFSDLDPIGPLAGVPIGVKDIYDHAGVPTGRGLSNQEPPPAAETASALKKLYARGAVFFGKTVTTERAYLDPGPTRNPWSIARTPGGSSSGSAAGVAARLFPVALGTQTAGSVIRPAAYCGVVGMTLTRGRVPLDGIQALVPCFDTAGFFVRSIRDAELMVAAWCGADGHGPVLGELPLPGLDRPVFLGLARRGFIEKTDVEAAHQIFHSAKILSQKGAIVHVLKLPESFDDFEVYHRRIFAYEAARVHREEFQGSPGRFGKKLAHLIEEGLRVNELQYHRALENLDRFRNEMLARLSEVDSIILPASTGAAPMGLDSTGDPRCNAPWTAIGFPAITIPSGLSGEGLPLGLQIVGKPAGERLLLRVARFCEEAIDFGCPEPPLFKSA